MCLYKKALWIFCGASAGKGKAAEVWKFSLSENQWSIVHCTGVAPGSRDSHTATYIGGGKFVVFGGQGFATPNLKMGKAASRVKTYVQRELFNDLFELSLDTLEWTPLYPGGLLFPMGRRGHSAVYINEDVSKMSRTPCHTHTGGQGGRAAGAASGDGGGRDDDVSGNGSHSDDESGTASDSDEEDSNEEGNSTVGSASFTLDHERDSVAESAGNRSADGSAFQKNVPSFVEHIPAQSLLIFGGSGIELSKYTEVIYNDLWLFSKELMSWTRVSKL